MKVAVISNEPSQTGKSSLCVLLASLFARTQHKRVAIFSTGDLASLFSLVQYDNRATQSKSVGVYNALLQSAAIDADGIYDYAYKIGKEEVYGVNIFSATMDTEGLDKLFLTSVDRINADLVLVEVQGDINEEFNKRAIDRCDAILNVFNMSMKSINAVKDYINSYDTRAVLRTGYICQKYDAKALSEKRIASGVGIGQRGLILIPYNPIIINYGYMGMLNTLAKEIALGHAEVINLRSRLLEIMQFLFDSPNHKYIKGVDTWHK